MTTIGVVHATPMSLTALRGSPARGPVDGPGIAAAV